MTIRIHCLLVLIVLFYWSDSPFLVGQEIGDEFGQMHVLLVADTDDEQIGLSAQQDVLRLKQLFETAIPAGRRTLKILVDENVNHELIEQYYENLDVNPNDTIFFFFAGHGIFYPEFKPRLSNEDHHLIMGKRLVPRKKILDWIEKKNARLNILLTDSCFEFTRPDSSLQPCAPPDFFVEFDRRPFMNLFFQTSGLVNINSADVNRSAVGCNENGGAFTNAFCKILTDVSGYNAENKPPYIGSWETFFRQISKKQEEAIGFIYQFETDPNLKNAAKSPVLFSPLPIQIEKTERIDSTDMLETLGFRWSSVPNKGLHVDEVRKFDLADWYGLDTGDLIVAVRDGYFMDVDLGRFSLDDCLNAISPYQNIQNYTPGKATVRVRRQNGNGEEDEIVLSTRKRPLIAYTSDDIDNAQPYTNLAAMVSVFPTHFLIAPNLSGNGQAFFCAISNEQGEKCGAELRLWNGSQLVRNAEFEYPPLSPWACRMSSDGQYALGIDPNCGERNRILLWRFTKNDIQPLWEGDEFAEPLSISTDSSRLAITWGLNGIVSIRDATSSQEIRRLELGEQVTDGSFSRDGSHILLCGEENLGVWEVETGKRLVHFKGKIVRAELHPKGSHFLLCEHRGEPPQTVLSLWKIEEGRAISLHHYATEKIHANTSIQDRHFFYSRFSPTGENFVTGESDLCVLWETESVKSLRRLSGVNGDLKAKGTVFSADGSYLLTAGRGVVGGAATLWKTSTGKRIHRIGDDAASVLAVGWKDDSKVVLIDFTGKSEVVDLKKILDSK